MEQCRVGGAPPMHASDEMHPVRRIFKNLSIPQVIEIQRLMDL